jgi:hypothetical protein
MHGRHFQSTYTHEFPQQDKNLFVRLRNMLASKRDDYPTAERCENARAFSLPSSSLTLLMKRVDSGRVDCLSCIRRVQHA